MNKFFLTGLTFMMTAIVNAQSINEQATKAGNDVFANAMIRNVLIVVGIAVVYYLFKSSSKKTDKNDQTMNNLSKGAKLLLCIVTGIVGFVIIALSIKTCNT